MPIIRRTRRLATALALCTVLLSAFPVVATEGISSVNQESYVDLARRVLVSILAPEGYGLDPDGAPSSSLPPEGFVPDPSSQL